MKIGDIEYGIRIPRAISKKYHNIFLNIERLKKPGDSFLIILEEERDGFITPQGIMIAAHKNEEFKDKRYTARYENNDKRRIRVWRVKWKKQFLIKNSINT